MCYRVSASKAVSSHPADLGMNDRGQFPVEEPGKMTQKCAPWSEQLLSGLRVQCTRGCAPAWQLGLALVPCSLWARAWMSRGLL
jgi:hypothetical protein